MNGTPGNMEGPPMNDRSGTCPICGDIYTEVRICPDGIGRYIHKETLITKPYPYVLIEKSCVREGMEFIFRIKELGAIK